MGNIQAYINMASALIVFIGGMIVVFFYPGQLRQDVRMVIGLLVTVYFILRMGQAVLMLRRDTRRGLRDRPEEADGDERPGPKTA
jgi:hypothetical protein